MNHGLKLAGAVAAVSLLGSGLAGAAEPVGEWTFDESPPDPITDVRGAFAYIRTAQGELVIGCNAPRSGRVWAGFQPSELIFGDDRERKPVVYRFDSEPPVEDSTWRYTVKSVLMARGDVASFLGRLSVARRFSVRVYDVEGKPLTASFDVRGAAEVVPRIVTICAPT